ncbi:MAG: SBBP repeat-containing protein [Ilumatobacteraceae bacterium]
MITEIIDSTGDGAGNLLSRPYGVAVDGAGNAYVTGSTLTTCSGVPGGVITEIIDATGDGAGNSLVSPYAVAVDGADSV